MARTNIQPDEPRNPKHSHSLSAWTSTVGSNTSVTSGTPVYPQFSPNGVPSNPYGPYQPAGGSGVTPNVLVTTPQRPTDGMIAYINNKMYRYSEGANEWHEVIVGGTTEKVEAPTLPIELDASGMLAALREYRDFLDDLDGLDQRYADAVSDTLFGLNEAIEALEKIE